MDQFLKAKVAIVTGAGRGLGAATAESLASAGAAIVLTSRTGEQVDAVATRLRDSGAEALAIPSDISNPEDVDALIDQSLGTFGRIDFLVNIAGTIDGIGKPTWELDREEWRALLDTNVTGPFLLSRAVIPTMLDQGAGRILMLTSASAETPMPSAGPYGATKAAVNQLVRTLALELAGTGVTVNAFNPGPVATPTLERVQQALRPGPWRGYWGDLTRAPEQAAQLILWLCSPAAAELTGEVVYWNAPATRAALARFDVETGAPGAVRR